jgi:hypothetical protein
MPPLKPAAIKPHWTLLLVAGLAGGLAWGVNARVWMRFIATRPEFTLSGTLIIVAGFGVAGMAQAVVYLGRRRLLRRPALTVLRVIGVVLLLPLSFGAGGIAFPIIIIAPLALTQQKWSIRLRRAIGVVSLVPLVVVSMSIFEDFSSWRAAIGTIWFLLIYAVLVWAARFSLSPQLDGWTAPLSLRLLGAIGLAPILALAVLGPLL